MPLQLKFGGHIVFVLSVIVSFRHSLILSETLTLPITFEQWIRELWYFTWVFLLKRPFHGYQHLRTLWSWPWPCSLAYFMKTLTLLIHINCNYWTVSTRALIFHMSISSDNIFPWVPTFFTLWPWPWSLAYFQSKIRPLFLFCLEDLISVLIILTNQWCILCNWRYFGSFDLLIRVDNMP